MNHELGHVHGLSHDSKEAYTVMSSSEKEDGSWWSWKWHFWKKEKDYRPEHLKAIKEHIFLSKGSAVKLNTELNNYVGKVFRVFLFLN